MSKFKNCGKDDCPACKGSLDTQSPAYEDATDQDKLDWTICRRRALAIDFAQEEKLYSSKSLSNLRAEGSELEGKIADLDERMKPYEGKDEDYLKENVTDAIAYANLMVEKLDLMMKLQTINRHINLKLEDWQKA